jgi:hypothetical protein
MKLHDKERATISGHPQIYHDGKPVGALPRLELFPLPQAEELEVEIHIVIGPNRATYLSTTIPSNELGAFWDAWNDNPELVAQLRFNWHYDSQSEPERAREAKPNGRPELTIDDLI